MPPQLSKTTVGCTNSVAWSQKKYELAMGTFIDAVVVEDENTGNECIKCLKEQRLLPQTFGGSARLVLGILCFDGSLFAMISP
jgi:hypothetical protein